MGGRIEEIHEEIEVDEEEDENVQILERIVMDESCQDTIEMECDFGGIQIKELRSGHKIVFNKRFILSHRIRLKIPFAISDRLLIVFYELPAFGLTFLPSLTLFALTCTE